MSEIKTGCPFLLLQNRVYSGTALLRDSEIQLPIMGNPGVLLSISMELCEPLSAFLVIADIGCV